MPTEPLLVAKAKADLVLLPGMANRHGLVAGATGTGKTVTLRVLAEAFSRIGVPVFLADVKGDLSGLARPGGDAPKVLERAKALGIPFAPEAEPVVFLDVYGEAALRTTLDTPRWRCCDCRRRRVSRYTATVRCASSTSSDAISTPLLPFRKKSSRILPESISNRGKRKPLP